MKKNKILFLTFFTLTIIFLCLMSANVAYKFCEMKYEIKYAGASAPASVSLLISIPYLFCIIIFSVFSFIFYKKINREVN